MNNLHPVTELRNTLAACGRLPDRASQFQEAIQEALEGAGWAVRREVDVPAMRLGNGRCGRVDLVGERAGVRIAIELDRRSPRQKSLRKLALIDATRVVIVRRQQPINLVDGIWSFGLEVQP